tara:strand:+ start:76 stop:258 length:183 start_codon:yes stop_codon:yes gene_type:complete
MAGCYFWGRYLAKREVLENVIEKTLMSLEESGFIKTVKDENGDKELVPISEILAESKNNT